MEPKKSNSSLFSRQKDFDNLENMPVAIVGVNASPEDNGAGSPVLDVPKEVDSVPSQDDVNTPESTDKPEVISVRRVRKSKSVPDSGDNYSCRFYTNIPIDVYLRIKSKSIREKRSMGDIVSQVLIDSFKE